MTTSVTAARMGQAALALCLLLVRHAAAQTGALPGMPDGHGTYADLAIHNLEQADGVNHGYSYREVPPPGVVGWYADFAARAKPEQPALVPHIRRAQLAVQDFRDWLKTNRPTMTAKAGVGREQCD